MKTLWCLREQNLKFSGRARIYSVHQRLGYHSHTNVLPGPLLGSYPWEETHARSRLLFEEERQVRLVVLMDILV